MCLTQAVASGANIASTVMGYNAAKANGAYQANVANANASLAEQQMVSVGQRGSYEQSQIRQKAKQVDGSQKAAFAANGLDIQAGSPLSVLSDTAYLSEKDVQTNRYNTQMQMWGLDNQATQYRAQAKYEKAAANNKAWGVLLDGISTAAKQYSALNDGKSNTASNNSAKITTPASKFFPSTDWQKKPDYSFTNPLVPKTKKWF